MNFLWLSLAGLLALAPLSKAADVSVTITNVHLCCGKCVKAADKTVDSIDGASGVADSTNRTVVITAPDMATAQKAVDALIKAGFYGGCKDENIKISVDTGAKGEMVKMLKVKGVHICCPSCVKITKKVLATVPGVTGDTVAKGAESFTVTGDFKDSDVFDALQKAGLSGKVAD